MYIFCNAVPVSTNPLDITVSNILNPVYDIGSATVVLTSYSVANDSTLDAYKTFKLTAQTTTSLLNCLITS